MSIQNTHYFISKFENWLGKKYVRLHKLVKSSDCCHNKFLFCFVLFFQQHTIVGFIFFTWQFLLNKVSNDKVSSKLLHISVVLTHQSNVFFKNKTILSQPLYQRKWTKPVVDFINPLTLYSKLLRLKNILKSSA